MTNETAAVDTDRLHAFMGKMVGDMSAAMSGALVLIGDKLGLYKSLAEGGAATPAELAKRTGTAERYVREWLAAQAASGYYANDVTGPLQAAAGQVWPDWGYGQFSQEAIWAATVTPGLTAGKTIVSMLPAWQKSIADYARSDGYQVTG